MTEIYQNQTVLIIFRIISKFVDSSMGIQGVGDPGVQVKRSEAAALKI